MAGDVVFFAMESRESSSRPAASGSRRRATGAQRPGGNMSAFMKRLILATVIGLFVIGSAPRGAAPPRPVFVPGELIVKFRPEAQAASSSVLAAHGLRVL